MSENNIPFKLSAQLQGHEADVRTVCSFDFIEGAVATGSRDKTIKIWRPNKDASPPEYECYKTLVGHTNYVADMAYRSPTEDNPVGSLVSASHDRNLFVWDIDEGNPKLILTDHEQPVCAVDVASNGTIVSGAWDNTARVWEGEHVKNVLKGHELNVLSVLILDNGDVITGSADKTIKKWRNGVEVQVLCRHNDIIRSMDILPGVGIVSCSNDGEVRITSLDGQLVQTIQAHDHIIYALCVLPSGEIATASEDKTVKIFKDGQCTQTIPHPGNVWDVKPLPNGDIVTGCSDYIARIWSRTTERQASQSEMDAYQENLANQQLSKKTIGKVDLDKLSGEDALQQPGQRDGQTKLIREGENAGVYQWSEAETKWIKIGNVVEGPEEGGKTYLDGQLYDYVFDIEIEGPGGVTTLKLPYNKGENPYLAAQKFIWKHELNQDYLEQIAQHIAQNSDQSPVVSGSSDPLTGGNRYVPGSAGAPGVGGGGDPFTGGGAGTGSGFQQEQLHPEKHYPKNESDMVLYKQANYNGIQKKLFEFNSKLESNTDTSNYAMNNSEQEELTSLISLLQKGSYNIDISENQFNTVHKLLQWPAEYVFPAVDLSRLIILCPSVSQYYSSTSSFNIVQHLIDVCFGNNSNNPLKMLCLRFLANAMQTALSSFIVDNSEMILNKTSSALSANAKVKATYVVLLFNSSIGISSSDNSQLKNAFVKNLKQVISSENDQGNLYTELISLGNMINNDSDMPRVANEMNFKQVLESKKSPNNDKNVVECSLCLLQHLSS
eukprot:gb/GECH01003211.1/.p1 GENE.gb/GECH01003211.1/~~gb/GECH01003211.1/.p1  ORF type:complete len:777 (+),score=196.18 gb/GECH01003211.1/:1-2331(+)